jgi:hypothetical protein
MLCRSRAVEAFSQLKISALVRDAGLYEFTTLIGKGVKKIKV